MMCRDEWFGKYIICRECLECRKEVIKDEEKAQCRHLSKVSETREANSSSLAYLPKKIFRKGEKEQPYHFTLSFLSHTFRNKNSI